MLCRSALTVRPSRAGRIMKARAELYPEYGTYPGGGESPIVPFSDEKNAEREIIHGRWAMLGVTGAWASENGTGIPWFKAGKSKRAHTHARGARGGRKRPAAGRKRAKPRGKAPADPPTLATTRDRRALLPGRLHQLRLPGGGRAARAGGKRIPLLLERALH